MIELVVFIVIVFGVIVIFYFVVDLFVLWIVENVINLIKFSFDS